MKVLIDNGHGYNTKGKGSPYSLNGIKPELQFKEWAFTREIARRLQKELKARGIDSALLVPEDIDISLQERCRRANQYYRVNKDVFLVSIHANAAGNGTQWMSARGWEIHTSQGITESDRIADFFIDEAVKVFKGKKIRIYSYSPLNRDKETNLYILVHTACPAVLTENFFQDNIEDVKYLMSEKGKEEIVKCHADAITKYIQSKKK